MDEQVIQRGAEFSTTHPLPGVWVGKNCVMVGDLASVPIVLADGTFVLPVIVSPFGPDGNYFNPGGGYTYTDAAVLRGRWRDGGGARGGSEIGGGLRIDWELSALVK